MAKDTNKRNKRIWRSKLTEADKEIIKQKDALRKRVMRQNLENKQKDLQFKDTARHRARKINTMLTSNPTLRSAVIGYLIKQSVKQNVIDQGMLIESFPKHMPDECINVLQSCVISASSRAIQMFYI